MVEHRDIEKIKAELRIMGFTKRDYQLHSEVINGAVVALEFRFSRTAQNLPSQLFKVKSLAILRVNNIYSLNKEITNLKNLRLLELIRLQQERLPKFIAELPMLEVFILSRTEVKSIPSELFDHASLRDIDLIANQIRYVPRKLINLQNLQYLSLSGFQDNAEELIDLLEQLKSLRKLFIGKFNRSIFPDLWSGLSNLTQLENLTISGFPRDENELVYVPPVINNLQNLESLWIDGGIMCFPDIPNLTNLRELYLFATPLNDNAKTILRTKKGICIDPSCELHPQIE